MISINSNLSSLIVRTNLTSSTNALNPAIERLTTGAKINGAKDNAAGYSISTNMSSRISSLSVAQDNTEMGLDMLTTASDSLGIIEERLQRLRSLQEQVLNGTYGETSLSAINSECNVLIDEISRLYLNTDYNGINLFLEQTQNPDGSSGFIQEVQADETTKLNELGIELSSFTIYNSASQELASYDTDSDDTLGDVFNLLAQHGISSEIRNGVITLTSAAGNYIDGELAAELGISFNQTTYVESTSQTSTTPIEYESVLSSTTEVTEFFTTTTSSTSTSTIYITTTSSTTQTSEVVKTVTVGQQVTSDISYIKHDLGSVYINATDKILDKNLTILEGESIPQQFYVRFYSQQPDNGRDCISAPVSSEVNLTAESTYGDVVEFLKNTVPDWISDAYIENGQIVMKQTDGDGDHYLYHLEIYEVNGDDIGNMVAYIGCYGAENDRITLPAAGTSTLESLQGRYGYDINSNVYISIHSNETNSNIRVTLTPDSTIQDLINTLDQYGIKATLNMGTLTIEESDSAYISYMPWNLEDALEFNSEECYAEKTATVTETTTIWTTTTTETTKTETVWTTTTTETTRTETISSTTTLEATGSTTLRELGQDTAFNVTVITDGSSSILTYNGDSSINGILSDLRTKGLNAEYSNGNLSLSGTGDSYIQSDELSDILNLGTVNKTSITQVTNTDSQKLTYSKDISDLLPEGLYAPGEISLQVGINGDESSNINIKTAFTLSGYDDLRNIGLDGNNYLDKIDNLLFSVSEEQTKIGAVQNRLMSVLDEISIQSENLISSLSTIRDADIAEVSSDYIRQQILQQASATLLATANQTPSIALQLL